MDIGQLSYSLILTPTLEGGGTDEKCFKSVSIILENLADSRLLKFEMAEYIISF